MELTHLDKNGKARMVDVSGKDITERYAEARAILKMLPATLELITSGGISKGDVFAVARIAGIQAAKRTAELIPLCHPIPILEAGVRLQAVPPDRVEITSMVKCKWVTGVEMEALTAASIAALTVYDMCKAIDRGMEVVSIALLRKSGGRSGDFVRQESDKS
jgi:cyclic pyranopterin monophosphate synthase